MNAIEKRARELLVDAYRSAGHVQMAHEANHLSGGLTNLRERAALNAIIAALTPPEGYVLVPAEPTEEEVRLANEAQQRFFDEHTMSMFFSSGHYNEESIRQSLRAVRTARPEVPNVND